jgi:hypothetical protein
MRRVTAALALAMCLLGCDLRGARVPLVTVETEPGGGCWLLHEIVDVVADPTSGTPTIKGSGTPAWPRGYTAWRAGTEVEVLDSAGKVVLTTGSRYWMCPTPSTDLSKGLSDWVIGGVRPCPDCELGGRPD